MLPISEELKIFSYSFDKLSDNAFSPYVVAEREKISEEKKPGFTHLANIVEFICKKHFNNTSRISGKLVCVAIEAVIRDVLGYPPNSANHLVQSSSEILGKFYSELFLAFLEKVSRAHLEKIATQTGLLKPLQTNFNFEIKYTNSISVLIEFGDQWKNLLKTDSSIKYNWISDFLFTPDFSINEADAQVLTKIGQHQNKSNERNEWLEEDSISYEIITVNKPSKLGFFFAKRGELFDCHEIKSYRYFHDDGNPFTKTRIHHVSEHEIINGNVLDGAILTPKEFIRVYWTLHKK